MRRFPFSSLSTRLALLVLLAVFPLLVLVLANAARERASAAARAQADALRVARFAASNQSQFVEQARQMLLNLAQMPELRRGDPPACGDVYDSLQAEFLRQSPRYANLGLVDLSGNIYCSVERVSGRVDVADRAYFRRALDTLAFSQDDYEYDSTIGKSIVTFGYPGLDFNSRPRLVIFAALDLGWLNSLAAQAQLPEGSTLTVIDRNGTILIRYPDPARWVGEAVPEAPITEAILARHAEGIAEAADIDGVQRLYAFTPLRGTLEDAPTAYVSIGIPSESAFAEADRILLFNLVALGLVGVIVVVMTWAAGNRLILRPIHALVRATHRLAAGDLSARTGLSDSRRPGELGQLAHAFDQMAESLQQRQIEREQVEAALRKSEELYRTLARNFPNGAVILFDHDLRYTIADGAGLAEVGLSKEMLEGKTVWEIFSPETCAILEPHYRAALTGTPATFEVPFADRLYLIYTLPIRNERGDIFAGMTMTQDITEQKRAGQLLEQRVEERTRELSTLLDISHSVASTLELKPLLGLILNQLKAVVDYVGATIFTLQDEDLVILDYRGPISLERARNLRFSLSRAGANRAVIQRRQPIIVADVRGDSELAREFQKTAGADLETTYGYIRCWMGVPLMIKEWVIGMLSIDHGEPGYYTARHAHLALAIANQAAIAIENARLYEQAQQLAALEERQKLARELHDSVSQALYGIALGARTARTLLDRDPTKIAEPLDYVLSLAEAGLAEMRALIFELRPESLETEGLVAALTKQAASVRARHAVEVHTTFCDEPPLPLVVKEAFYRIAQEALHNIVKHARAGRIDLRLACEGDHLVLDVIDDGVGFDTSGSFPGHLGLQSMRERAEKVGAALDIDSAPGRGARIRVRVSTGSS